MSGGSTPTCPTAPRPSATGWLLGLTDERVIELSAVVNNTALTEVRHWGTRRTLVSFNALPHLPGGHEVTAI